MREKPYKWMGRMGARGKRSSRLPGHGSACFTVFLALAGVLAGLRAAAFSLDVPGIGTVEIPQVHVDPGGNLIQPTAPAVPTFSPPTIFSAPLPSGSGARALGLAGAFTAVADDATAASWNPGGLIQLERPEVSFVWRGQQERDRHWSGNPDYAVGEDTFDGIGLNYLSAVLPFRIMERNAVFSLNYQEVFDFNQRFHARFRNASQSHDSTFAAEDYDNYDDPLVTSFGESSWSLDVTEYLTTHRVTTLDQVLNTETLGELTFDQEGLVTAFSPALAMEVTPTLSFGAAMNVYGEGWLGTPTIHSRTRAVYSGTADSLVTITDARTTDGTYSYSGVYYIDNPFGGRIEIPVSGPDPGQDNSVPTFNETTISTTNKSIRYNGVYSVDDRISNLTGANATLGGLWVVSRELSLGFCLDLPWTAYGHQTRTISTSVTTLDETGVIELGRTNTSATVSKGVEFHFPLSWSVGGAWRWSDQFTTSLDISQTLWSQYYFKSKGDGKINPLDGSPYGDHTVRDCWSARVGGEYLWLLQHTEIPLRAGFSWEQRPAIGQPDQYWGVSLGTGISLGSEPGKVILDVAYSCTWGQNVMATLVPGQEKTMGTDVLRQEVFVSCIVHF
ncbi:MAG: outer membrane protein transport protein [Kiritimatiellia bacterium]